MIYEVKKACDNFNIDDDWKGKSYANAEILRLQNFMGEKPQHFPKVEAKLLYDDKNIYVFFKVDDRYVRAIAKKTHDSVCRDSCVEFFFTPGENIAEGYFNIEINCGGTILLYHQTARGKDIMKITEEDCEKIKRFPSMPKIVEPEIQTPTTWTLKYAIPVSMLEKYAKVNKPAAGTKWKANFYKCADSTSHPHWLTWAKVDLPTPDFHRPEFFQTIAFK